MQKLMLGNEAIARGAYEAGAAVVSSYPGTPSTEITEFIAKYPEIDLKQSFFCGDSECDEELARRVNVRFIGGGLN